MKENTGLGLEGSQAEGLLSLLRWTMPPSQRVYVVTNLEAPRAPYFWDFYGGFTMDYGDTIQSLTQSPAPLPV